MSDGKIIGDGLAAGEFITLEPRNYCLCRNIWGTPHPHLEQETYDELVSGQRWTLIYVLGGAYVGEGSLVFSGYDADYIIAGRRVYLSRLVVRRECRRQGIGSALIQALCDEARRRGYVEISVGVDTVNEGARRLYERHGFTTVLFEGEDEQGEYVKLLKRL